MNSTHRTSKGDHTLKHTDEREERRAGRGGGEKTGSSTSSDQQSNSSNSSVNLQPRVFPNNLFIPENQDAVKRSSSRDN